MHYVNPANVPSKIDSKTSSVGPQILTTASQIIRNQSWRRQANVYPRNGPKAGSIGLQTLPVASSNPPKIEAGSGQESQEASKSTPERPEGSRRQPRGAPKRPRGVPGPTQESQDTPRRRPDPSKIEPGEPRDGFSVRFVLGNYFEWLPDQFFCRFCLARNTRDMLKT